MKKFYEEHENLIKSVAITLVAFILWMLILSSSWKAGVNADYWSYIEAVSTAFAAAAVIGAAYFAFQELNETAVMRYMEVADRLFQELNSEENIAARRWIYSHITAEMQAQPEEIARILDKKKGEGRIMIKRVLNSLDRVAFLTQNGWIPEELIMPWMNPMVVKIWEKVGLFVEFERDRRVKEPDYYEHAQKLAEECVKWRKAEYGYEGFEWLDKGKVL